MGPDVFHVLLKNVMALSAEAKEICFVSPHIRHKIRIKSSDFSQKYASDLRIDRNQSV